MASGDLKYGVLVVVADAFGEMNDRVATINPAALTILTRSVLYLADIMEYRFADCGLNRCPVVKSVPVPPVVIQGRVPSHRRK